MTKKKGKGILERHVPKFTIGDDEDDSEPQVGPFCAHCPPILYLFCLMLSLQDLVRLNRVSEAK